jgi:hypothetical protein
MFDLTIADLAHAHKIPADARVYWAFSQLTYDERVLAISLSQAYIRDFFGSATLVYKTDRHGNNTSVAIAVVKPVLDSFGQFAKKQHAPQFLTQWFTCTKAQPEHDLQLKLWLEAMVGVYHRFGSPVADKVTEHRIKNSRREQIQ